MTAPLDAATLARIENLAKDCNSDIESDLRNGHAVDDGLIADAIRVAVREERARWQEIFDAKIESMITEEDIARAINGAIDEELSELRARAEAAERELAEAREAILLLDSIIRSVQRATGDYLPPDGIEARDALNRIIEATDGPEQRRAQSLPAVRAALREGGEK